MECSSAAVQQEAWQRTLCWQRISIAATLVIRHAGSRLVDRSATFACVPSESVISYHTWPNAAKPSNRCGHVHTCEATLCQHPRHCHCHCHCTIGSRLVDRSATFACVPSESVISYHTWPNAAKPKIVAVAALLQSNQSAIVTLKSSGIERPAQLDGKKYASYAARYESRIVQQMIRADGGSGDYVETTPPMLGIWNTLLEGAADATWVFLPWEGVAAQRAGIPLNTFKLEDFGIPYCYSPVLAAHPNTLASQPGTVRSFLAATAKGYEWAAAHPKEAAALLCAEVAADAAAPNGKPLPEALDPEMVAQSQEAVAAAYLNTSSSSSSGGGGSSVWGVMDLSVWEKFLDWLSDEGLLTSKAQSRSEGEHSSSLDGMRSGDAGERLLRDAVAAADLATNAYLPAAQ